MDDDRDNDNDNEIIIQDCQWADLAHVNSWLTHFDARTREHLVEITAHLVQYSMTWAYPDLTHTIGLMGHYEVGRGVLGMMICY